MTSTEVSTYDEDLYWASMDMDCPLRSFAMKELLTQGVHQKHSAQVFHNYGHTCGDLCEIIPDYRSFTGKLGFVVHLPAPGKKGSLEARVRFDLDEVLDVYYISRDVLKIILEGADPDRQIDRKWM